MGSDRVSVMSLWISMRIGPASTTLGDIARDRQDGLPQRGFGIDRIGELSLGVARGEWPCGADNTCEQESEYTYDGRHAGAFALMPLIAALHVGEPRPYMRSACTLRANGFEQSCNSRLGTTYNSG